MNDSIHVIDNSRGGSYFNEVIRKQLIQVATCFRDSGLMVNTDYMVSRFFEHLGSMTSYKTHGSGDNNFILHLVFACFCMFSIINIHTQPFFTIAFQDIANTINSLVSPIADTTHVRMWFFKQVA